MNPQVEPFFDPITSTVSYVVYDAPDGHAAIIDPVLGFDPKAARTDTVQADKVITFIHQKRLNTAWILETHAHADHLSAAQYLKSKLGGKIAIGAHIREVQGVFKSLFNLEAAFLVDGSQFDHLFADDDMFAIGTLTARALFVPGHTPADMAYHVGDAVFVGDTLFMPDVGTARCDFPGGDARTLYRSIRRILALPATTRLFVCHDYPPSARAPAWHTTVAHQRAHNIHVHDGVREDAFVAMRHARDCTLGAPVLLFPAVQVNIRAGALPPKENNGVGYLKIPINIPGLA